MKLTNTAIAAITTKAKNRLALELECSVYSVDRWINKNENNNDLTKAMAVQIIAEETSLTADQILEESKETESATS